MLELRDFITAEGSFEAQKALTSLGGGQDPIDCFLRVVFTFAAFMLLAAAALLIFAIARWFWRGRRKTSKPGSSQAVRSQAGSNARR